MRTCIAAFFVLAAMSASVPSGAYAAADKVAPNTAPPATDLSNKSGTLSDELDSTNGVIHPSGEVDPKMEKPAPAAGAIRVIPPPNKQPTETPK
jgi:hypothetical protein